MNQGGCETFSAQISESFTDSQKMSQRNCLGGGRMDLRTNEGHSESLNSLQLLIVHKGQTTFEWT